MRKAWKCTAGAVVLLTVGISADAQVPSAPSISTSGDAEVRVVPDEVILNVGVETADKVLKIAKAANDAAVARAIKAAKRHGIAEQYLQTEYISVEPHYKDYDPTGTLLGYVVRKSLSVRLRDISKFEALLSDLVEAGVNVVHGIDFRTTELRKYRDQARALAIKAAQEKAQALCRELGRSPGKALNISEGGGGWWSAYNSWWGRGGYAVQNAVQNVRDEDAGGSAPAEGGLAPGQITVTAHVSVTFALE